MVKIKLILLFLFLNICLSIDKVDINNSTYEELKFIPISEEKLLNIYNYLSNYGNINTIDELLDIESITSKDIISLKKYIFIDKTLLKDKSNYKDYSYKLLNLLSDDGSAEGGVSANLVEYYFNKHDVNSIRYDELISLINVSPMDAVAVLKQQNRGKIKGTFQLKNSPGISYYGYKNLLDFVQFQEYQKEGYNKSYKLRIGLLSNDLPSLSGLTEDDGLPVQFLYNQNPQTITKLAFSKDLYFKNQKNILKVGLLRNNNAGEPANVYNEKFYLSYEGLSASNAKIKIDRMTVGNFMISFGQGVVFESSDFYNPRSTGYKYNKRQIGIYPDLTQTAQFSLNGIATQLSHKNFRITMFASKNKRDAVINSDGSFSNLIIMRPRLGYGYNEDIYKIHENMINSLNEVTYGTNFRFSPSLNTHIAFTMYESLYDRILNPQVLETIIGGDEDYLGDDVYLNYHSNSADSEINALYHSSGESWFWKESKSFRQVSGIEFTKIFNNLCIQAEYGELNTSGKPFNLFDGNPNAFVINSYIKFNTFDLIALFRDYDLHYDNPYQRSFSEYRKFKSTIFEDSYWLEDPIFYNLYSNNPQPQAEKGFYVESRYQFHEDLVAGLQYDSWIRKADNAQYYRIVSKLEWRPLYNYRIYFRYKWQERATFDIMHPSPYYTKEARIRFKLRLSNFDDIEFLYSWNYTTFSPRPPLTHSSDPFVYEMNVGDIGSPDRSIGLTLSHNLDENLKIKAGSLYADGFLWYIEDDDFRVFENTMGLMHNWVSLSYVPNQILSLKVKISKSTYYPYTTIVSGSTDAGYNIDNPFVFDEDTNFKIQIDYAL